MNCDVFVLCQSTVETGIGLRIFVFDDDDDDSDDDDVWGFGCCVTVAAVDESVNTGRSISRNIINKSVCRSTE